MESSLSACTVRGQFTTIPKNLKSAVAPMVYTRIYKLFMMNRDSDATEIEDESLHLYFSSEESASLLSGSPQVCHVLFCFQMYFTCRDTSFKRGHLFSLKIYRPTQFLGPRPAYFLRIWLILKMFRALRVGTPYIWAKVPMSVGAAGFEFFFFTLIVLLPTCLDSWFALALSNGGDYLFVHYLLVWNRMMEKR